MCICMNIYIYYTEIIFNTTWWSVLLIVISVTNHNYAKILLPKKHVCVVGAGPSGLVSLKQLVDNIEEFEPIVFEQKGDIGGQWLYTDKVDGDEYGLPVSSAIYKSLRVNSPKEYMACPDYERFRGENSSYIKHKTVLEYLRNFTRNFNLHEYIQLNTLVEKAVPVVDNDDEQTIKWQIEIKKLATNFRDVVICDFIIIGHGASSKQFIPKIPGIENFPGRVLHSQVYRRPEEFANQTVVVLGASFSGREIAFEISDFAEKVYLSHRHDKIKGEMSKNVIQIAGVVEADGSELTLQDGSRITANSFIFCTGYKSAISFLNASSGLEITKKRIFPLYQQIININYPSMGIVGLVPDVRRFCSKFYLQAKYYISFLQGKLKLPSRQEMLKDAIDMSSDYIPKSSKITDQFAYLDELAETTGVKSMPDWMKRSILLFTSFYWEHQLDYRDYALRIHEDGYTEFFKASSETIEINV